MTAGERSLERRATGQRSLSASLPARAVRVVQCLSVLPCRSSHSCLRCSSRLLSRRRCQTIRTDKQLDRPLGSLNLIALISRPHRRQQALRRSTDDGSAFDAAEEGRPGLVPADVGQAGRKGRLDCLIRRRRPDLEAAEPVQPWIAHTLLCESWLRLERPEPAGEHRTDFDASPAFAEDRMKRWVIPCATRARWKAQRAEHALNPPAGRAHEAGR